MSDQNIVKIGEFGNSESLKQTPKYMAPELWKGSNLSSHTDIWAVGCILFELCFLKPPSSSDYAPTAAQISNEMDHLLKRMLTQDFKLRATAEQLLR